MGSALSGNLAELGLDDILQIVAVSRKTGILTVKSRGREAILQCRDGLLVRATSTGFHQSLGELMVQNGVIDAAKVRVALSMQQQEGFRERIGTILHKRYKIDLQVIEKSVRQQIYNVVMTLFGWHEGDFDFAAKDDIETVDAAYLDPVQLMLEHADKIKEISIAAAAEKPLPAAAEQQPQPTIQPDIMQKSQADVNVKKCALIVVDDDQATSEAVANHFPSDRVDLFPLTRSEDALVKIDALYRTGVRPIIVIDLIMPKMDGSGVLGGLELLKLIKNNFSDLSIVLMTDFRHAEAEAECEGLGCICISKPRRGNVEGEEFEVFINKLQSELQKCHASGNN